MRYRLPIKQIFSTHVLLLRCICLILIGCASSTSLLAQTPNDIEQKVDAEVNSFLAELESKQSQASTNSSNIRIYNRDSKQRVATVSAKSAYSIVQSQSAWLLVRFNQAVVPGWVSQEYVVLDNNRASTTASILNLRSQASTSSSIIDRLPRGYTSRVLDQKNGFVKILAPSSLVVALKKSDLSKQGVKSSPSWFVNEGENIASDKPQVALNSSRNQNLGTNVGQAPTDSKQASNASRITNEQVQSTMELLEAPKRTSEKSHIIAPGDAISLVVFGESDLSIENVRVPQSGQVSLPLIGAVSVAGKTSNEVEQIVYKLLSQGYVRNPRLSVSIFSYRPIFIRGAVRQTGSFPFAEGLTIAKAIALAGGSKNSANKNGVSILRDGTVVLDSLSIDSQVEISSGDVISVTEEFGVSEDQATYVYLHGEVASPGEYLYRRGLTVEKAVVLAGGFTLRASRKKVSVTRYINKEEGEEPERLKKVRLYTPVQPGDIIDVGASWF